jgi:pyruvate ferredoxin oxidoreductase delta subunit
MGLKTENKYLFKYEACWSDGNNPLLCLNTGDWRTSRPVINNEICNCCGICMTFCPPQCIRKKDDAFVIDMGFCKGCGICARECPKKAISMKPEGGYSDDCKI